MNRILVTGATGFVGRAAVPALVGRGFQVEAVSSRLADSPWPGVRLRRADLLDPVQAAALVAQVRPDHLLHLAWRAVSGDYLTAADNLRWFRATLELLETFAAHGGRRAVLVGTCFEYDARYGYCVERLTPRTPTSLYGVCKAALGDLLEAAGASLGISTAWARLFFLYGPHEHPRRLVASVIRPLLRHEPARCSHGAQLRDYLHVDDVGGALASLAASGVTGSINVGLGRPVVLRDIIFGIADRLGGRHLVELGAVSTPPDEPPLIVADTTRLRVEVGWQPRLDLDAGLEQTIAWWRQQP